MWKDAAVWGETGRPPASAKKAGKKNKTPTTTKTHDAGRVKEGRAAGWKERDGWIHRGRAG